MFIRVSVICRHLSLYKQTYIQWKYQSECGFEFSLGRTRRTFWCRGCDKGVQGILKPLKNSIKCAKLKKKKFITFFCAVHQVSLVSWVQRLIYCCDKAYCGDSEVLKCSTQFLGARGRLYRCCCSPVCFWWVLQQLCWFGSVLLYFAFINCFGYNTNMYVHTCGVWS